MAKNVVMKAATILSKSYLQQILIKEAVKIALVRIRDIEQTTKKVIMLSEATLCKIKSSAAGENKTVDEFFASANAMMDDYGRR